MSRLFYIQDKRAHVGNSMVWWRKEGRGYGCDIREAEVFDEDRAKRLIADAGYKYQAWPKDYIDSRISHHIDMQHCEHDESCFAAASK